MINTDRLDRDWYEGIVQKLKWNVPLRTEDSSDVSQLAPSRQASKQENGQDRNADFDRKSNGTPARSKVLS